MATGIERRESIVRKAVGEYGDDIARPAKLIHMALFTDLTGGCCGAFPEDELDKNEVLLKKLFKCEDDGMDHCVLTILGLLDKAGYKIVLKEAS